MAAPIHFRADDRFDACLGRGLSKFNGTVEVISVGEGNSRKVMLFGQADNGVDGKSGIEERVVAVEVQGNSVWRTSPDV